MQLAFPDAIYLVDAIEGGEAVMRACKPALESKYITKVIHDCKRDSEIAYSLIEEQKGREWAPDDYISFVSLLADPRYCGISYLEKEEVRVLLRQDPAFWTYRPLSEMMIRAATDDVRFLLHIYHKMIEKLTKRFLWLLAVRSSLYCSVANLLNPLLEDRVKLKNVLQEMILIQFITMAAQSAKNLHSEVFAVAFAVLAAGAIILTVKCSSSGTSIQRYSRGVDHNAFMHFLIFVLI